MKDFACQVDPSLCIGAGEGLVSSCSDNYEINNNISGATTVPVNAQLLALINPAGDKDFFKFHVSPSENNLRVTLGDMPKNYDLFLYDQEHILLYKSSRKGVKEDSIIANNLSPQDYFVKVKAKNTAAHDATDCYALLIETSSSPFRVSEIATTPAPRIETYPNPFSSRATIILSLEEDGYVEIGLYDLSGRRIRMLLSENLQAGTHELQLNREQLPAGVYVLKMMTNGSPAVHKLVIE